MSLGGMAFADLETAGRPLKKEPTSGVAFALPIKMKRPEQRVSLFGPSRP